MTTRNSDGEPQVVGEPTSFGWTDIRDQLEREKRRITQEISDYPRPITACDAQFNYLLEQRALIRAELGRLRKAEIVQIDNDEPARP